MNYVLICFYSPIVITHYVSRFLQYDVIEIEWGLELSLPGLGKLFHILSHSFPQAYLEELI